MKLKTALPVTLALIAALAMSGCSASSSPKTEEAAAKMFMEAAAKGDVDRLLELTDPNMLRIIGRSPSAGKPDQLITHASASQNPDGTWTGSYMIGKEAYSLELLPTYQVDTDSWLLANGPPIITIPGEMTFTNSDGAIKIERAAAAPGVYKIKVTKQSTCEGELMINSTVIDEWKFVGDSCTGS